MRLSDLLQIDSKILSFSGGCHSCPRGRKDFVPAQLGQAPLLLVGDMPGNTDAEIGQPFAGDAGRLLRAGLSMAGVSQYAMTNVVHCKPPAGEVTPKEVSACMNQCTNAEIQQYPIVALLGNVPQRTLFPKMKSTHLRGNIAYHPDYPGQRFYSMYHPLDALRNPKHRDIFNAQVERLGRIVRTERPAFRVVTAVADFLERLRALLQKDVIGFDIECNRLESWATDAHIRSFSVCADDQEALFCHEGEPYWHAALQMMREYLEQPRKQVIGMHIGFDLVWLERALDFKVRCEFIHDVGVLYYQLKQYKRMSLKELVARELDGYRHLVYEPHKEKNLELLAYYNCEDVIYPYQLWRKGVPLLKPKTRDLYIRVAGPSDYALQSLSDHGVWLRQDHLKVTKERVTTERAEVLKAWKAADAGFNPYTQTSGKDLEDYLFQQRQFPIIRKSDKNDRPSTDESVLKELMRKGYGKDVLPHLLKLRELDKELSTYVLAYEKLVWPDNRIHPGYNNTVTDTGRTSSDKPNFQNVPRKRYIRDLFGVPPGYVLLQSDFSQIELRIAMAVSGDEEGIAAYLRGEDLHTSTARAVAGAATPTKEQRTHAKAINFALIYGGTDYTVKTYARDTYGIEFSDSDAKKYVELFFSTYPRLKEWHERCNKELIENQGWAEHAAGHVFYYEDWNNTNEKRRDHAMRAHINSKGQGPAGYMAIYTLILAQREFLKRGIPGTTVGTVHDSIMTEVKEGHEAAAVEALNDCVKKVADWCKDWFCVPLIMDHEVGPSWGSLKTFKAPGTMV